MNIHEAANHSICLYCNQALPAAGERWKFSVAMVGACATECAREFRPFSKIILLHFMMEPCMK